MGPKHLPLALAALLLAASAAAQTTYYVDPRSDGAGDGQSWPQAFPNLHLALLRSEPGDTIRIAGGRYTPDVGHPFLPRDSRYAWWSYSSDVWLRGGYRGLAGGGSPDDRNIQQNPTILSGEIGNPNDRSDNSLVLMDANVVGMILLDGLVFRDAYQDSAVGLPQGHNGSALWSFGSAGILMEDVAFVSNTTVNDDRVAQGGTMFLFNTPGLIVRTSFIGNRMMGTQFQSLAAGLFLWQSDIMLRECLFQDNRNESTGGGAYGGAVYLEHGFPTFENVVFRDNFARNSGGAVFHRNAWDPVLRPNRAGAPTFRECLFQNNLANQGGAAFVWSRRPADVCIVENCRLLDNKSVQDGAAIYSNASTDTILRVELRGSVFCRNQTGFGGGFAEAGTAFDGPGAGVTVTNCTIADNHRGYGLEFATDPAGDFTIINTILRGNQNGSIGGADPHGTLLNSSVEGLSSLGPHITRANTIDVDPLFCDPNSANYRTLPGSPCIDAGDSALVPADLTSDVRGLTRIIGSAVDMGAYEVQRQSPFMMPSGHFADSQQPTPPPCPGDLDGDRYVGLSDMSRLLANFGMIGAALADGDADGDGDVDIGDLSLLLAHLGSTCP